MKKEKMKVTKIAYYGVGGEKEMLRFCHKKGLSCDNALLVLSDSKNPNCDWKVVVRK